MRSNAAAALIPIPRNRIGDVQMQVNLTARPPARNLPEILTSARLVACGLCEAPACVPCVIGSQGTTGLHCARVATAYRQGFLTGPDLVAVLAVPAVFAASTIVWSDGAA